MVIVAYYLAPMDNDMSATTIAGAAVAAAALTGLIAFQVWRISHAAYPTVRAVESVAFTTPFYVVSFATLYYLLNHTNTAEFGTSLSRTDTLYFSTTVFTTVRFGDIAAKTDTARIIVTVEMALGLLIVGLVARLIVNAVNVGRQRQAG